MRWLILGVLGVAQLMVVLDATIVNIALPSAQHALGFSDDARQWIVTAYALAFGSLLLLGGRIGDLFGRKNTFIVGLIGFALASALGGFAQSFGVLVAARALQGAFGALLAPAALSLLTTTFVEPDERNKAFGVFGAIAGGGGAIGLLLGGVLTEYLSWRWCLYVNLFFAGIALFGALRLLHNQIPPNRPRLDIPGTITGSMGLFALVFGLSRAATEGWGSAQTVISLVSAAVLLGAFVAIQRRVRDPLLPMRVVLDRNRGGSYLAVMLSGAGMFAVFLFLTYYMQLNLHYTPIKTGLAFLPMIGFLMAAATTSQTQLVPRFGPRPLVVTGMIFGALGMLLLTGLSPSSTYVADILPALLAMGLGMGLIIAPSMSTATLGVDPKDAGVASAMVNTSQQVGGSIGTALLSSIAASAVTTAMAGQRSTPGALAAASVHGYTTAFWAAAAIFAAGAVLCGVTLRSGAIELEPGGVPAMAH